MVSVINKIRTFISRFKDTNFRKGISTLIGAGLMNFLAGAIYSLCTLSIYEISYVKRVGGNINIDHLSFYYPIEIIFQCFSSIISGIIYKELGLHLTNLIGITVVALGYFMMYISKSLLFDLLSMVLGGMGTGIILYPSTTNSYKWFTEHTGIIVGVMETMISFGSFFFAFIGEKIINNEERTSNSRDNLYDLDIGQRIKDYLIIQIISLISAFILSFILMYEKRDEEEEEEEIIANVEKAKHVFRGETPSEVSIETDSGTNNNDNNSKKDENHKNEDETKESSSSEEKIEVKEEKIEKNENNGNNETNEGGIITDYFAENSDILKIEQEKEKKIEPKRKNSKKKKKEKDDKDKDYIITEDEDDDEEEKKRRPLLKKGGDGEDEEKNVNVLSILKFALKSKRLMLFSAIVILQAPVSTMAFTLYREIGEYKKIELKYLQLVGSLYFIFECLSSFVFGILCDYIQLKYLLFFINGVGTFVGFIYCLTFENGLVFFLVQNFLSFSAGGYYPVKDCYLMKVFGNDIYIELSGYVSFLVALTVNLLTPITYFVQSNLEEKEIGYWILFVSFGVLNLIGLILNIFIKETPLDLKEAYVEEKGSKQLSLSLNYFHNSFKNSFHTSFHKV